MREFVFSEEAIGKQREELQAADLTEKELWVSMVNSVAIRPALTMSTDRASTALADKLLRSVPDPCALEGHPAIRRERAAIWSPGALRRLLYQGQSLPSTARAPRRHLIPSVPQPESKATKRTLATLQSQLAYLGRRGSQPQGKASGTSGEELGGEYQTLLEQEYFDFVLFEIPWIVL